MSQFVTLLGADDVRAAGRSIGDAAERMAQVASRIDGALDLFVRRFEEHVARIEAAMQPREEPVSESKPFEGWAVIELMGHRRIGGRVTEQEIAGTKMLRVDIPGDGPADYATQFYGGSAIYCLTPTTEEMARAAARASRPEPITRWELPQPRPVRAGLCDGYDQSCVLPMGHRGDCTDAEADVVTCAGCGKRSGPDGDVRFVPSSDDTLCAACARPDAAASEMEAAQKAREERGRVAEAIEAAHKRVADCAKCLSPSALEEHTCHPEDHVLLAAPF